MRPGDWRVKRRKARVSPRGRILGSRNRLCTIDLPHDVGAGPGLAVISSLTHSPRVIRASPGFHGHIAPTSRLDTGDPRVAPVPLLARHESPTGMDSAPLSLLVPGSQQALAVASNQQEAENVHSHSK